jgi:thiamine-monophosphate kinase
MRVFREGTENFPIADRPSEDELIARYFAPLAGLAGLALAVDVALIQPPPGCDLAATTDALVAGVHFFADDPPDAIARKALRVNLSDLAAKGARPLGFLLSLALPADRTTDWLEAFANGLGDDARNYDCPLIGGDTVRTPGPLTLSITAFGAVEAGKMVARTGVRAGDRLYVTGTIGDAALGLRLRLGQGPELAEPLRRHLLDRYLLPRPRLALARAMAAFAHGGMDVSDGLVGDLMKMLRVSGVTARIDLGRMPLSDAASAAMSADPKLFEIAATGGDDYELLAAVPSGATLDFERAAATAGVGVTLIGKAAAGKEPPRFVGRDGKDTAFVRGAFSHF